MNWDEIPREDIAFLPTPLQELPRLSRHLGVRVLIKRDDHTGFAFGGNKIRKLEYILREARDRGTDVVLASGGAQSNHCRQTAAAARKMGLDAVVVLGGNPPGRLTGNILLNDLLGARMHFAGTTNFVELDQEMLRLEEELRQAGRRPYAILRSGSVPTGILGFVRAAAEMKEQMEEKELKIDWLFLACGSGGTQAGLELGTRMLNLKIRIVGINVNKGGPEPKPQRVSEMANATAGMLGLPLRLGPQDITVAEDYVGEGYSIPTEAGSEAIRLVAGLEGIFLDPTYTGKAMAGLIDWARRGRFSRDDVILFWHTGGQVALFADKAGGSEHEKPEE